MGYNSTRPQPVPFSHKHHVSRLGSDAPCRAARRWCQRCYSTLNAKGFAAARHDEPGRIGAGLASDPDAAQRIIVARAWFPSTRSICSAAPWC